MKIAVVLYAVFGVLLKSNGIFAVYQNGILFNKRFHSPQFLLLSSSSLCYTTDESSSSSMSLCYCLLSLLLSEKATNFFSSPRLMYEMSNRVLTGRDAGI